MIRVVIFMGFITLSDMFGAGSPAVTALMASIPVYLLIAVGWICRRAGWLTSSTDKGLTKVAIELCYPCFILHRMLGNDLLRSPLYALKSAGVGAFICVCSILLCLLWAKCLRLKAHEGARTFAITSGIQNFSFFVIPIVLIMFNDPGDPTMGVLFTHNVGFELMLWTVGLLVMSEGTKLSPRLLLRGPIIAVLLGLILSWTNLDVLLIPKPVDTTMSMLGACAVPLSLILVGTTFFDLLGKFRWSMRVILGSVAARCGFLPVFILCMAYVLPIDETLRRVLIIQAAIPSAVIPILLARAYGGRPEVAVQAVISTTVFSILSLPIWLSIGFSLMPCK